MKYLQTIVARSIMDRMISLGQSVTGNRADYGFFLDDQIDMRYAMVRRIFITDESTVSVSAGFIATRPLLINNREIFAEGFPAKVLFPSRYNFLTEISISSDMANGARVRGEFSNPDGRSTMYVILELVK
jgi:hypothetical protein